MSEVQLTLPVIYFFYMIVKSQGNFCHLCFKITHISSRNMLSNIFTKHISLKEFLHYHYYGSMGDNMSISQLRKASVPHYKNGKQAMSKIFT